MHDCGQVLADKRYDVRAANDVHANYLYFLAVLYMFVYR